MKIQTVSSILLALIACAGSPAGPPTGSEVLETFVERSGGREALAAVESFRVHGSYELPAHGLSGTIDLHFARPERSAHDETVQVVGLRSVPPSRFERIDDPPARALHVDLRSVGPEHAEVVNEIVTRPREAAGNLLDDGEPEILECGKQLGEWTLPSLPVQSDPSELFTLTGRLVLEANRHRSA